MSENRPSPEEPLIDVGTGWDALYPEDLNDPLGSSVQAFQGALDRMYEMFERGGSPSVTEVEKALFEACPKLTLEPGDKLFELGVDGGCVKLLTALGASCYGSEFDTGACGTSGVTYVVNATASEVNDWVATLDRGTKLLTTLPDGWVCAAVGKTSDASLYWMHCSVIDDVVKLLAKTGELESADQDWLKIFGSLLPSWGPYLTADSKFPPWQPPDLVGRLDLLSGIMVKTTEQENAQNHEQPIRNVEIFIDIRLFPVVEETFIKFYKSLRRYKPLK